MHMLTGMPISGRVEVLVLLHGTACHYLKILNLDQYSRILMEQGVVMWRSGFLFAIIIFVFLMLSESQVSVD